MSANLPDVKLPIVSSINNMCAPFMVIIRSASSTAIASAFSQLGGSHGSVPSSRISLRVTKLYRSVIGPSPTHGKSLCQAIGSPGLASKRERTGLVQEWVISP